MQLNADVGEGFDDNDIHIMPFIDQANIACGGHAGNKASIARTATLAKKHGVSIGAHPSYVDKEHFGRRSLNVELATLETQLHDQVQAIADTCDALGTRLSHIKAHGALYNDSMVDHDKLRMLMQLAKHYACDLMVQSLPDMQQIYVDAQRHGIQLLREGFADRAYQPSGLLAPRSQEHAVFEDIDTIVIQARALASGAAISCIDGESSLTLSIDSICVHGDSMLAIQAAKTLHHAFR